MAGCSSSILERGRLVTWDKMRFRKLDALEGLCLITPAVHVDAKDFFMETYSARDMV